MRSMTSTHLTALVLNVWTESCPLRRALEGAECTIEHISMRPGQTLHRIKYSENCEIPLILKRNHIRIRKAKRGEIWAESKSCNACSFVSKFPFLKVTGTDVLDKNELQIRATVPSLRDLKNLKFRLKRSSLKYEFVTETASVQRDLTKREKDALYIALQNNYFECENRTSLTSLARIVGISASSLSDLIRRGTKRAVMRYLDAGH